MTTNYRVSYPATFKKQVKPLLHQQMWLFGRDILCPEGNLLYQYQFTHTRAESRGGSMYTRRERDRQVVLWGWGIWFGQANQGAIFVNRYKARPRFAVVPTLTQTIEREEALPHLAYRVATEAQAQVMRRLWSDLLRWLAGYEAWVLAVYGRSWRQSALKSFSHAVTKLAAVDQLAAQWQKLAEQSRVLPIKSYKN